MNELTDVTVVIVNWNGIRFLDGCLSSIDNVGEVILVDNASEDGSVEFVQERFPTVQVITNSSNRGFSAANNQGARHSDSPFILFLNNDTVVRNGSLVRMREAFNRNVDIGVVGAKLIKPDGAVQSSSSRGWVSLKGEVKRILLFWDQEAAYGRQVNYNVSHFTKSVCGAGLMIRRSVLQDVGGWPEEYFAYAEDVDLCRSVVEHGWKIWYESEAEILHFHGGATKRRGLLAALRGHFLSHRSVNQYIHKYEGKVAAIAHAMVYPVDLGLIGLRLAWRLLRRSFDTT